MGQPVQVLEGGGEARKAALFQKRAHTQFDAGRVGQGGAHRAALAQRLRHHILALVFGHQRIDRGVAGSVDVGHQIAHPVAVDAVAKGHLRRHFVPFGHGHLTHIVAEAGKFGVLAVVPGRRGPAPHIQPGQGFLVLPVADDDFAAQTHARADEAELPPAVRGLVQIHKVHIDGIPGNVPVELGVELGEGLLQGHQAGDPHFGRGKGVHPRDQTDAVGCGVGLLADGVNLVGCLDDGFEDDIDGNPGRGVQAGGDGAGVVGHLLQDLRAVEMLAAGDKPDFEGWKGFCGHQVSPVAGG